MLAILRIIALPFLLYRAVSTFNLPPTQKRTRSIKFRIQMISCVILAIICQMDIVIEYSIDIIKDLKFAPSTLVSDSIGVLNWYPLICFVL